jgi:hypothetical protein
MYWVQAQPLAPVQRQDHLVLFRRVQVLAVQHSLLAAVVQLMVLLAHWLAQLVLAVYYLAH